MFITRRKEGLREEPCPVGQAHSKVKQGFGALVLDQNLVATNLPGAAVESEFDQDRSVNLLGMAMYYRESMRQSPPYQSPDWRDAPPSCAAFSSRVVSLRAIRTVLHSQPSP